MMKRRKVTTCALEKDKLAKSLSSDFCVENLPSNFADLPCSHVLGRSTLSCASLVAREVHKMLLSFSCSSRDKSLPKEYGRLEHVPRNVVVSYETDHFWHRSQLELSTENVILGT